MNLEILKNKVRNCHDCSLSSTVIIRPVPGQGLQSAKIMLVKEKIDHYEAKMEDNLNGPHKWFVKKLFGELGLTAEDIYITSVIKCNCNSVRVEYLRACVPWLEEEIKLVQPKVIVALGAAVDKYLSKYLPDVKYLKMKPIDRLMNQGSMADHAKEIKALIDALNE